MISRIGRFCFQRPWRVLLLLAIVVTAGALSAGPLFRPSTSTTDVAGPESAAGQTVAKNSADHGTVLVAIVDHVDPSAEQVRTAVARASSDVQKITGVGTVGKPAPATDSRALAVTVTVAKLDRKTMQAVTTQAANRMRELSTALPGTTVRIGGPDVLRDAIDDATQDDLTRFELIALPSSLLLLMLLLGGVLSAFLPVFAGVMSITGSFVMLLGFSLFLDIDSNIVSVITVLGIGLSIDYGLLLVTRYREELAEEHERTEAISRTWDSAGRTILFSALTVAAALSGLLFFDMPRLQAVGAAGVSVAVVAMVAALTTTAAFLRLFRVKASKRALARRAAGTAPSTDRGFFAGLARAIQRVPVLVAGVITAGLLAAALPLLGANLKMPQLAGFPRTIEAVQAADELANRFGESSHPALTVIARTAPSALDTWAARWRTDPDVARVEPAQAIGHGVSSVNLAVHGDSQGSTARDLVTKVRADRPPGAESWVSGDAANLVDTFNGITSGLPGAITALILATLILLFLMSGSIVVPIKAIVMNILSLGATFGVLIAVFQHGWLSGPLDTLTIGGLSPIAMVVTFAFAFAVSMDYEVFLICRIKEYVDAGEDTNTAVRHGLQRSGRVISSAALLMLVIFGAFGSAKVGDLEQLGIGLFVAVLVDATVVRCLLVPATMTLFGRWNWWAPAPLRALHRRFHLTEHDTRPTADVG
ncbi:MMPL family transporter [Amycolatopsis samaneae]|uniref:MMPL family transporter n=1 Tax=Amycolatopsis samaneae TaxID=664691 RepID=A0ABW5GP70_9PSEU